MHTKTKGRAKPTLHGLYFQNIFYGFSFQNIFYGFPFLILYCFQEKKKKSLNLREITAIPFEGLRHPALWLDVLAVLFVLFISV